MPGNGRAWTVWPSWTSKSPELGPAPCLSRLGIVPPSPATQDAFFQASLVAHRLFIFGLRGGLDGPEGVVRGGQKCCKALRPEAPCQKEQEFTCQNTFVEGLPWKPFEWILAHTLAGPCQTWGRGMRSNSKKSPRTPFASEMTSNKGARHRNITKHQ